MRKSILLFFVSICIGGSAIKAQFTDILNFNSGNNGMLPVGSLLRSGNLLYGMTNQGGIHDSGSIFCIDTNGNNYRDLFNFAGPNGKWPEGGTLKRSGNKLFGMVNEGGRYEAGVIFSIDTNGSGYKILLTFNDTDGGTPRGSLTLSGKVLYGMTLTGGAHDSGCIFLLDTNGANYKDLFDCNFETGYYPWGDLTLSGGLLFGMQGFGAVNGLGNIFSIDTNGNNYKDILDFNGTNGAYPSFGTLKLSGNKLFGMTYLGGLNDSGCAFSIDTSGMEYKDLLDFNSTNGSEPWGSLTLSGSKLFGTTMLGGANDEGTIFVIDTSGSIYADIFDFNGTNGRNPEGDLTLSGNLLYGMTPYGGTNDEGIIFTYNEASTAINELNAEGGELKVYPNPSNGIFTIQSSVIHDKSRVEIYNALGEQICSLFNSYSPTFKIDLSFQPNGIYFYRDVAEDGALISEGKLIIQK